MHGNPIQPSAPTDPSPTTALIRHGLRCLTLLGLMGVLTGCGQRPWNVLLLTLDTTRADFLGCYGKSSARTPNLDRLAAEGFLFEHAYSSNPVTQAAHSTILTGVYPMVHGVRDNGLFQLPEGRDTLAEILKGAGYATGAAIGGFPLTREFGTRQGFDFYDDDLSAERLDFRGRPEPRQRATWYDERPAGHVNDAILPWLRERAGEPFFVWLHYWDPHEPHIAPAPYGQLFAHDPYQGEIAYADDSLGTILRFLEDRGELDRTLIAVTADHGESRHEHNEATHAFLAFDTTLHVPLILRVPDLPGGRRITERVGTVDIVPTVLDLLGIAPRPQLQGRSLRSLMAATGGGGDRRPYYSESLSPRLGHGFGELRVLYQGPWKYIHGPRPELYHLESDPRELEDLAATHPEEARGLESALQGFLESHASPESADAAYEADEATLQQLAALGYLSTDGDGSGAVSEVLTRAGVPPQDRVRDINLMHRLRREIASGRFHPARRTAQRLLEADPDNAYLQGQLARALVGLGEVEDAARIVEASAKTTSANVASFLRVASALAERGDLERGIAMARGLLSARDTADGRVELARMLLQAGDGAGFEAAIASAKALEHGHRAASLELARYWTAEGRIPEAEDELDRLLSAYPTDVEAHLAYARLLRADQRLAEATTRLERVLRLGPGDCEAHLEKVSLLAERRRSEAARAALTQLRDRCLDPEIRSRATDLIAAAAARSSRT